MAVDASTSLPNTEPASAGTGNALVISQASEVASGSTGEASASAGNAVGMSPAPDITSITTGAAPSTTSVNQPEAAATLSPEETILAAKNKKKVYTTSTCQDSTNYTQAEVYFTKKNGKLHPLKESTRGKQRIVDSVDNVRRIVLIMLSHADSFFSLLHIFEKPWTPPQRFVNQ